VQAFTVGNLVQELPFRAYILPA